MRPALYSSSSAAAPPVHVIQRAPLPPFDPDEIDPDTGAPLPVYTELRAAPPANDPAFWRGDAWGVTIKGLPLVQGGAQGAAANRVLTYFLDRYGRAWEERILHAHLERGYTHFSISPQDSFAAGMSPDEYVEMAKRVRAAGFQVHHLMRSKYYTPATMAAGTALYGVRDRFRRIRPVCRNLDAPPFFRPGAVQQTGINLSEVDELIEALLDADAMQVESPAWEMNYWSPSIVRQMIDHDAALIGNRCRIMLHFYAHYISWQENDESPTDFWRANYGLVDGCVYQCDPFWCAGMQAARLTDCLDRLAPGGLWGLSDSGRGHPIDLTCWETIATAQFNNMEDGDGRLADEDIGNLKGYENQCAPGRMIVQGYGNGARLPDGWAL